MECPVSVSTRSSSFSWWRRKRRGTSPLRCDTPTAPWRWSGLCQTRSKSASWTVQYVGTLNGYTCRSLKTLCKCTVHVQCILAMNINNKINITCTCMHRYGRCVYCIQCTSLHCTVHAKSITGVHVFSILVCLILQTIKLSWMTNELHVFDAPLLLRW